MSTNPTQGHEAKYPHVKIHQTTSRSPLRLLVGALLLLLPGCTSTHVQSSRTPAGFAATPFRNIIVVGMDPRQEVRNPFENDVAASLQQHGVSASASWSKYSLDELKGDKEQIRRRLQTDGAQAVLFVRVTDRDDFATGSAPASLQTVDMGQVDESRYNALTRPGGDVDTSLRLGARLYRVSDGAVMWSGLVVTVVKEDYDSIVLLRNIANTIVGRMATDKVIP